MGEERIRQLAQTNQLGADTYLAGPGLSGWTPAAQVPWLASEPAAPAPPAASWGAPGAGQAGAAVAAPAASAQSWGTPAPGPVGPLGVPGPVGPLGVPGPAPMMGAPPGAAMGSPMGMAAAAQGAPKGDWVKERLKGLLAVAVALLVLVGNLASVYYTNTFYPKSVILGLGALFYGGWVMIFGDEFDDYTMELVRWKQIGMYGAGGAGALIGLVISILIAE